MLPSNVTWLHWINSRYSMFIVIFLLIVKLHADEINSWFIWCMIWPETMYPLPSRCILFIFCCFFLCSLIYATSIYSLFLPMRFIRGFFYSRTFFRFQCKFFILFFLATGQKIITPFPSKWKGGFLLWEQHIFISPPS